MVGVGETEGVGDSSIIVGVGLILSVIGEREGINLPNLPRRVEAMRLLESKIIIKNIKAKNISMSLLDVISLLRR